MNKNAKTKYGLHPLLESRWSPCSFSEEPVERKKLLRILEAAQWAPSSMNEQPWRFILGEKGSSTYNKIFDSLMDGNKKWAKFAPVLIVSMAKKHFVRNSTENYHFLYDTGQATAHLTFQAMHEGLHVHQMGGFYTEMIRNYFSIPDEYAIAAVIAIGYLGKPDILDDALKERETRQRVRRALSETVFTESFGNSFDSDDIQV